MYEIPFGKGRQYGAEVPKALDYVLGGWQWNNIVTLQTGTPMDINVNGLAGQTNRPDVIGPVSVHIDHSTGKGILTGDFTTPPVSGGNYARAGDLGRNAVYGPGYHDWDMGMMKDLKFTGRFTAEARADVFNLLNHPQFTNGSFNTNVGNGGTGTTSNAQTRFSSARQLQFAVRFIF
jgi:hypothetical protein